MVETDESAQLVAENSCQLFWLPANGERFRDAKQSCVALSISSQRELWFWGHMLHKQGGIPPVLTRVSFNIRDDPFRLTVALFHHSKLSP